MGTGDDAPQCEDTQVNEGVTVNTKAPVFWLVLMFDITEISSVLLGFFASLTWEQDAIHAEAAVGAEDGLAVTRRPIVSGTAGEMELYSKLLRSQCKWRPKGVTGLRC